MSNQAMKNRAMWRRVLLEAEDARRERGGHTIILDQYVPWRDNISLLGDDVYYVVYPVSGGGWGLKCLPPHSKSLKQRVPMPTKWAGLRGEELCEVSGVSGATFCHPGRFIAHATSKDAALALAEEAYTQQMWDEKVQAVRALRALFADD